MAPDINQEILRGAAVVSLLREVRDARASLEIFLPPNSEPLRSRLVGFMREDLLIEAPTPKERLAEFVEGARFEVHFFLAGRGYYVFQTSWLAQTEMERQHVLAAPTEIHLVQRRQAYRVIPAATLPARCLSLEGKADATAVVENVSVTGVGVSFARAVPLALGSRVTRLELRLENKEPLTLSGIVRSTHITPEGRCYLGIEFQQLGRLEQRALHDYVFRCQRRELHRLH